MAPETKGNESTTVTPQDYGVGARFTLSVYDSNYIEILGDALGALDHDDLVVKTGDISTYLTGSEQNILATISEVIARAARSGAHLSASVLLSRGCPGELRCELPPGVEAIGAQPVTLEATGIRARAHWSLYPLMAGGDGTHMDLIYAAIERAHESEVFSGSESYATRLDGDLAAVLSTAANAWIEVGAAVQHVVTHLTISINSPTQIAD